MAINRPGKRILEAEAAAASFIEIGDDTSSAFRRSTPSFDSGYFLTYLSLKAFM